MSFGYNKLEVVSEAVAKVLLIVIAIGLFFTNQILLGVIMLAIIFFSGEGYKPWLYLFNKSDSLIVGSTGIQFFYPVLHNIKWEDVERIWVQAENRKMIIERYRLEKLETLKIELRSIKIKDYRIFQRQLQVYIDRYVYE